MTTEHWNMQTKELFNSESYFSRNHYDKRRNKTIS